MVKVYKIEAKAWYVDAKGKKFKKLDEHCIIVGEENHDQAIRKFREFKNYVWQFSQLHEGYAEIFECKIINGYLNQNSNMGSIIERYDKELGQM